MEDRDTLRLPAEVPLEETPLPADAAETALLDEDVWLAALEADREPTAPASSGVFPVGLHA